jgi:hypothetical protein
MIPTLPATLLCPGRQLNQAACLDQQPSGYISVHASVISVTHKELPLNERLYALLNDNWVGKEASRELAGDFCDDGVVVKDLQRV